MMAPRFWTDPFRRDAEMQHVVEKRESDMEFVVYLAGEPGPRWERMVEVVYSDGHRTAERVPA